MYVYMSAVLFCVYFLIEYVHVKRDRGWRTFKRPGVDAFLEHLAKFYELVVYSDQLSMVRKSICWNRSVCVVISFDFTQC